MTTSTTVASALTNLQTQLVRLLTNQNTSASPKVSYQLLPVTYGGFVSHDGNVIVSHQSVSNVTTSNYISISTDSGTSFTDKIITLGANGYSPYRSAVKGNIIILIAGISSGTTAYIYFSNDKGNTIQTLSTTNTAIPTSVAIGDNVALIGLSNGSIIRINNLSTSPTLTNLGPSWSANWAPTGNIPTAINNIRFVNNTFVISGTTASGTSTFFYDAVNTAVFKYTTASLAVDAGYQTSIASIGNGEYITMGYANNTVRRMQLDGTLNTIAYAPLPSYSLTASSTKYTLGFPIGNKLAVFNAHANSGTIATGLSIIDKDLNISYIELPTYGVANVGSGAGIGNPLVYDSTLDLVCVPTFDKKVCIIKGLNSF